MWEEIKTKNHKFTPDGEGGCTSRPATKEEIEAGREEIRKAKGDFEMRSCYECNGAHPHLMEEGRIVNCFACGRWYASGVDVMDYEK